MPLSVEIKDRIRSVCNVHRQGQKANIALFATPRGGSTWVMELLAAQPGMKFFDEPFNIRRENVMKTGLFNDWGDLMPETSDKKKILDFVSALGRGDIGHMNPSPFQKNYRFFTDRVVFKIHAIEHMINAVRDTCNCSIVYLVRHPISNTLSRRVFPRLQHFLSSEHYMRQGLSSAQTERIKQIAEHGTHIEKGVLSWCFENVDAFRERDRRGWTIVTYEELVQNPQGVCKVLGETLDLPDIGRSIAASKEPSSNVAMSDEKTQEVILEKAGEERVKHLISRWRQKVTESEERDLFSIVDLFGIDFYSVGRDLATHRYLLAESDEQS